MNESVFSGNHFLSPINYFPEQRTDVYHNPQINSSNIILGVTSGNSVLVSQFSLELQRFYRNHSIITCCSLNLISLAQSLVPQTRCSCYTQLNFIYIQKASLEVSICTANFGLLRMVESSWWAELLSAVNVECLMKTAPRDGACTRFYDSLYDFNIKKTYVIWLSGGAKYSIMTWVFQITPTTNKGVNVIFELTLVY